MLAQRFAVDGYPLLVFADAKGQEVDRLVGYYPPEEMLEELRRIRAGRSFASLLRSFEENPTDRAALDKAVKALLDRSDPESALARIEAFRSAAGDACPQLVFEARLALQSRLYRHAAKLHQKGWQQTLEISSSDFSPRLRELLNRDMAAASDADQARWLRQARHQDATILLESVPVQELATDGLRRAANFAFASGHYSVAGDLYVQWYRAASDPSADQLNLAAWNLYLSGQNLDRAEEMARKAYAADDNLAIADTLVRILYVTGSAEEAIALGSRVAAATRCQSAAPMRLLVREMKAGHNLDDSPGFEFYPWDPAKPEPKKIGSGSAGSY